MLNVMNRFLKYVNICTASDESSSTFPSSPFQLAFGEALAEECRDIGLKEVNIDEYGYVSAFLPSNTDKNAPSVCFIAHMDTSPDASVFNIKPIIT